jgi:hypothetical protein
MSKTNHEVLGRKHTEEHFEVANIQIKREQDSNLTKTNHSRTGYNKTFEFRVDFEKYFRLRSYALLGGMSGATQRIIDKVNLRPTNIQVTPPWETMVRSKAYILTNL